MILINLMMPLAMRVTQFGLHLQPHPQEEDMNNALQAYNVMTSPSSDVAPQRSINSVHIHLFYHVAQANQAQRGSLVDRGVICGVAGSDVKVLSKSSRKCTVTVIDQHQINLSGHCAMCCTGQNQPWVCQPHHE